MKATRRCKIPLFVAAMLFSMPSLAKAEVIYVWPHDFSIKTSSLLSLAEVKGQFRFLGHRISGAHGNQGYAFARVNIPIGKTVRKLRAYMRGTSSSAFTSVVLKRSPLKGGEEDMASVWSSADTGGVQTKSDSTVSHAEVEKGYLYYLVALMRNDNSYLYGVKIIYR